MSVRYYFAHVRKVEKKKLSENTRVKRTKGRINDVKDTN